MLYVCSALLLTAAVSLKYRKRPERVLPPLLCLGVTALFLLALPRALPWADALAWAGLAAALALGWSWFSHARPSARAREAFAALCTPGMVCILLLAAGLWWGCRERLVWFADEVNYWAAEAKSLWYFRGFVGGDLCLDAEYASYLPGLPLLEWAAMRAAGVWNDGTLYFAQYLTCCVLLLPLTERIRWRQWYWMPVFCASALAVPTVFNAFAYAYLGADVALGCAFAYALVELRRSEFGGRFSRLCLGGALCLLVLLKASGMLLALLVLLGAWMLRCPRPRGHAGRIRAAACWLAPLLLTGGWMLFCRLSGLSSRHGAYVADGARAALDAGAVALEMLRALAARTAHAAGGVTYRPLLLLPFAVWAALLCGFPWAWRGLTGGCVREGRRVSSFAVCAFAGYLLALWVGFLTVFGAETASFTQENQHLMGRLLERYLCPVFMGLTALCAWEVISGPTVGARARRLLAAACAALLLACGEWQGLSVYLGGPRYAAAFAQREDITRTVRERLPFTARMPYEQPALVMVDDRWMLRDPTTTQYGASPIRLTYFYVEADYPLEELLAHFRLHGVTHAVCMSREEPFHALMAQLLPGQEVELGAVYELRYREEDDGVELVRLALNTTEEDAE